MQVRVIFALFLFSSVIWANQWPNLNERNLAGDRLELPELFADHTWQLVALALSDDQDVGSQQQQQLLQDQQWIQAQGWSDQWPIYQMPVIAGAPRLVQGLIRRGLAGSFPEDQDSALVVAIFLANAEQLTTPLGISMTEQGHWLLIDSQGMVRWHHNGTFNQEQWQSLMAVVQP